MSGALGSMYAMAGRAGGGNSGGSYDPNWLRAELFDFTAQGDHDFNDAATYNLDGTDGGAAVTTLTSETPVNAGDLVFSSDGLTFGDSGRRLAFPLSDILGSSDKNTQVAIVARRGTISAPLSGTVYVGYHQGAAATQRNFFGFGISTSGSFDIRKGIVNAAGSITNQDGALTGSGKPQVYMCIFTPRIYRIEIYYQITATGTPAPDDPNWVDFPTVRGDSIHLSGIVDLEPQVLNAVADEVMMWTSGGLNVPIEQLAVFTRQLPAIDPDEEA